MGRLSVQCRDIPECVDIPSSSQGENAQVLASLLRKLVYQASDALLCSVLKYFHYLPQTSTRGGYVCDSDNLSRSCAIIEPSYTLPVDVAIHGVSHSYWTLFLSLTSVYRQHLRGQSSAISDHDCTSLI